MADQLSSDLASLRIDRDRPRPRRAGAVARAVLGLTLVGGVVAGGVIAWPHLEARVFRTDVEVGEIVSVSPAQSQTTLTAAGYVVARTLSHVSAKTAGRVARVHVVEGQEVHLGDVLVELDPSDQATAIASARARVAAAQARVEQARAGLAENDQQLARTRPLVEHGAISRATLEDLQARAGVLRGGVSVALADARSAQAEVHALEVAEQNLTVLAPIAGTVITKPVELGEIVSPVTEITQIADFSSIVVEIDVPEARLSLVRVGGPCEIVLDAFPGRRYRGQASEIGRRVNRVKAAVPVRVRFAEPADGVLPDMSAHVSFLREALSEEQLHAAARIVVPTRAVVARHGQQVVFVIADGVAQQRSVRLGEETPDGRVLLDGPEPGTRVVINPPSTLETGQAVKEREQ